MGCAANISRGNSRFSSSRDPAQSREKGNEFSCGNNETHMVSHGYGHPSLSAGHGYDHPLSGGHGYGHLSLSPLVMAMVTLLCLRWSCLWLPFFVSVGHVYGHPSLSLLVMAMVTLLCLRWSCLWSPSFVSAGQGYGHPSLSAGHVYGHPSLSPLVMAMVTLVCLRWSGLKWIASCWYGICGCILQWLN